MSKTNTSGNFSIGYCNSQNLIGNQCFCTKRYFFENSEYGGFWVDNIVSFFDNFCSDENCKILKIVVNRNIEGFNFKNRSMPVLKIIINDCIIKNIIEPKCVERIIFRGSQKNFKELMMIHNSLKIEFDNCENDNLNEDFELF